MHMFVHFQISGSAKFGLLQDIGMAQRNALEVALATEDDILMCLRTRVNAVDSLIDGGNDVKSAVVVRRLCFLQDEVKRYLKYHDEEGKMVRVLAHANATQCTTDTLSCDVATEGTSSDLIADVAHPSAKDGTVHESCKETAEVADLRNEVAHLRARAETAEARLALVMRRAPSKDDIKRIDCLVRDTMHNMFTLDKLLKTVELEVDALKEKHKMNRDTASADGTRADDVCMDGVAETKDNVVSTIDYVGLIKKAFEALLMQEVPNVHPILAHVRAPMHGVLACRYKIKEDTVYVMVVNETRIDVRGHYAADWLQSLARSLANCPKICMHFRVSIRQDVVGPHIRLDIIDDA